MKMNFSEETGYEEDVSQADDPIGALPPQNTSTSVSVLVPVNGNSGENNLQTTTYTFIKDQTSFENIEGAEQTFCEIETKTIHDPSVIVIEKCNSTNIKSKNDSDPHFTSSDQKPTTYLETFAHMLKGNIGVGLFTMGMAFKNGGLLVSTLIILVIGLISWYNQYKLVEMANEFQTHYNTGPMSFARTIEFAFQKGPRAFQKSANFFRFSVEMCIIATQLGFCCVYIMFVASTLEQLLGQYGMLASTSTSSLMTMVLPVFWITALIRDLKYIAPLSTLANFAILAPLTLIMINNVQNLPSISERSLIGEWKNIPLCFGAAMYSLEGISLVIPLQQNMKKKEQFLGACGVLNVSFGICVCLLITIGFFGYYKQGDEVAVSLTFNLDRKSIITQIVVGALVLSVVCTYTLQFFVPVYILLPWVRKYTSTWPFSGGHLYEYIFRSLLVLLTYSVVMIVPHLDLLVSLIGAVGGTLLGLVYLPIADLAMRNCFNKGGYRNWRILLPISSLLVGTVGFFLGTAFSLSELISAISYEGDKES